MPFYKDELTNIYNNYKNNKSGKLPSDEMFKRSKVLMVQTNLDPNPSINIKYQVVKIGFYF